MKPARLLKFLTLLAALILAACGAPATPTPTPPPAAPAPTPEPTQPATPVPTPEPTKEAVSTRLTCAEPVKVGLITDASGSLAIYGAHILRSFMLGMEYMAGAPGSAGEKFDFNATKENTFKVDDCEIQIFVRDDASNPQNTATIARELIDVNKVNILVGTVSSGATATLQGIAFENKIPLIVAPAAANDITGKDFNIYTFRVSRNNYQDAMNVCTYLTKQYKKFVQIAPDYAFGRGSAAAFRDACGALGGEFVVDDIFAPADTTDFTPYMERILNSGAEAYIVTWAGSGFVPLFQAAKDLGVNEKMSLASAFIDNALMPVFFGDAVGSTSGIIYHYTVPKNPANDFLVANTKPRYGVNPDIFDADGMNAAILLVEALRKTGGDVSGEALIKAMEGMSFEGPKGTVYIRPEDHVAIQDMYILKLTNLTDPDAKFYEYVATNRPEPPCLLPENLKARCGNLPYGSLSGK
ncbi:MAG: substrate-binding domain-containing protein [Roseiflexus sp.]|nr:substrate-binding domain-containing protein [Roseiflexus sp.]MCS7287846.1 substrate-binding domain-containing protein [Roseiflexus sp.]MDW8147025.1 substrate-binding domain-containing protein [Roseiflexaceae bacterium]MDW8233470.1 substrate-binding domain-containing protein [Roseiflexaceae bacterium]